MSHLQDESASSPKIQAGAKSAKNMTRAERRELQDKQRSEKQALQKQKKPLLGTSVSQSPESQMDSPVQKSPVVCAKWKSKKAKNTVTRQEVEKPIAFFSHLPQYEKSRDIQSHMKNQDEIHPLIHALGLKFSEFIISGANARCISMLCALKRVVMDYHTVEGTSLPRSLATAISKQVGFLSSIRSLDTNMKTAIRFLKSEVSILPPDIGDEDAKVKLIKVIDEFVKNRIIIAGDFIIQEVVKQKKIVDGDVILTYAKSSLSQRLFLHVHEKQNVQFKVIVVDSYPKYEGKVLFKALSEAGIKCKYVLINSLPLVIREATKVVIGACTVYADGSILSRVGTSLVCSIAHKIIPVIVLSESCKFSEEVRLDSITWNEIGDPDELVNGKTCFGSNGDFAFGGRQKSPFSKWRDIPQLKLLNLHYDVTPAKFITLLVCEYGLVKSACAAEILRIAADKSLS